MNLRIIAILVFLPLWIQAADDGAGIEVHLREYYNSIGSKSVERAVGFYHPKSAKLDRAKAEFEQFTQEFDLSYKITNFKRVGEVDGDIVVGGHSKCTTNGRIKVYHLMG